MNHKLPPSFYVIALLGLLLLWATHVIGRQQAVIDARPLTEDFRADARVEDTRRGPVRISRTTIIAPDGAKTTTSVRDIGPVESHIAAKIETAHEETPITPVASPRTRYVGIGVDPLDYARWPRLRAGVTLWGVVDVGIAYDSRFSPVNGAFQIEAAYRF